METVPVTNFYVLDYRLDQCSLGMLHVTSANSEHFPVQNREEKEKKEKVSFSIILT